MTGGECPDKNPENCDCDASQQPVVKRETNSPSLCPYKLECNPWTSECINPYTYGGEIFYPSAHSTLYDSVIGMGFYM